MSRMPLSRHTNPKKKMNNLPLSGDLYDRYATPGLRTGAAVYIIRVSASWRA